MISDLLDGSSFSYCVLHAPKVTSKSPSILLLLLLSFISYATSTFDQILEPLYMQLTHTPEEKRNQALVDSMMRKFNISANIISNHLSGRQYICGDRFTAADCVIGYNIWWASVIHGGMLLQEFPVLLQYLEQLKQRPAFEKVFKGHKPVKPSGGSL